MASSRNDMMKGVWWGYRNQSVYQDEVEAKMKDR